MRNRRRLLVPACLFSALLSLLPIPSRAAEEGTVIASGPWKGQGRIARTGPEQAVFWGSLEGVIFVQGGTGPLDNARFVCPAAIDVQLITGQQRGEGRCIITLGTGDHVEARWTCTGEHIKGCRGRFLFTSGTGKAHGITGDGDFIVRSALAGITVSKTEDIASESAVGLILWPALRYRIP
jgi:hypothetical protein